MNIIIVAGASATARSLTIDWRHWVCGGIGLIAIFLVFTFLFNYATLRYAAATGHPLLKAIVLADQREEAVKNQQVVQGHLNTMAMKLGELQAQMLRLDGLGSRLARSAGLKPQELPSSIPGITPGRGGAMSSLPAQQLSLNEFSELVGTLAREVEAKSDQLGVLERLLLETSASKKFIPTLLPIEGALFSSNFGWRIDPFNGQKAFHEGVDFPADPGTVIVAAASGRVIFADSHPQYGKMIEIDHGNGLVTRYAHASMLLVKEGDLVVRGRRIAAVGSTGRSTGAHLHFEVRQQGVPKNPANFLKVAG